MSIQEWPSPGIQADVPSIECSSMVADWLDTLGDDVLSIVQRITDNGGGIWIVGGAVRDACLGLEVHDIDFAVTLTPKRMMELFPDAIPTGIDYGTVSLRGDAVQYEVTTLRTERNYGDGRRPEEVNWGLSLAEDLQRRDFTINAMAIDVARRVMHDPHHGLADMERGIIRAVGQAYRRISEDGLRILRAYRFLDRGEAGVWSFDFELHEALRQNLAMLDAVTSERVWMEWHKILQGSNAADVIQRMAHDHILDRFLPGQWEGQHLLLASLHHPYFTDLDALSRFSLLLCECSSIEVDEALRELKLSNNQRGHVLTLHQRFGTLPQASKASLRVFRAVLEHHSELHLHTEIIIRTHGLHPSMGLSEETADQAYHLLELLEELSELKAGHSPLVDGHWLMQRTSLGKGRALGRLKDWLYRLQIERDLDSLESMESVLCTLVWDQENHLEWPKVQFPDE